MKYRFPAIVFLTLCLCACKAPETPTLLRIQNPQLLAITDTVVVFRIEAVVQNPNKYSIQIHRGTLACTINETPAGNAFLDSAVSLPAMADAVVPVKLNLLKERLLQNGLQWLLGTPLSYTLMGNITASRGGLRIKVPVQEKGLLDQSLIRDLLR